MVSCKVSILDSLFSYGNVGTRIRRALNAEFMLVKLAEVCACSQLFRDGSISPGLWKDGSIGSIIIPGGVEVLVWAYGVVFH